MAASGQGRKQQYFIPGDGIAREVIEAGICKYLDNDATLKPGNFNGRDGYFIYAYRSFTTEMVADLRSDSAKWLREKEEKSRLKRSGPSSSTTSGRGGKAQKSDTESRYTESASYELTNRSTRTAHDEFTDTRSFSHGSTRGHVPAPEVSSGSAPFSSHTTAYQPRYGQQYVKPSRKLISSSERRSSPATSPSRAFSQDPSANPEMLRKEILNGNLDHAAVLIDRNLSDVARGRYEWLIVLHEMGYSAREIANVLHEDETMAPWLSFETVRKTSATILDPAHHLHDCVHQHHQSHVPDITEHAHKINLSALTQPDADQGKRSIEQFIGLGGVGPFSKDQMHRDGRVFFELNDHSIAASVTYSRGTRDSGPSQLSDSLRRLADLISICGHLQGMRLFCNSFTILAFRESSYVEMTSINMALILEFKDLLEAYLDRISFGAKAYKLWSLLSHVLHVFGFDVAKRLDGDAHSKVVHCCSLATQALCVGLLSYASGHTGLLQTGFLDRPLQKIDLLGHRDGTEEALGTIELNTLTCANGLTKGEVRVFRSASIRIPHELSFDLLASPEDLIDTWGPGQFIQLKVPNAPERHLVAIEIGGGYVYRPPLSSKLHYKAGRLRLYESLDHFEAASKYILGASWRNRRCPKDESECFTSSLCALHILGTRAEYYELRERHTQFQGGQYIAAQFGISWLKHDAITLKDLMLDHGLNLSLGWFLFSPWGVKISMCTGVAKRTTLANLLSEVMVTFVNRFHSVSRDWEELLRTHRIIQVLSTTGTGAMFDSWLQSLPENLQTLTTLLIRAVLEILRRTGYDSALQELVVAWPHGDNPFWCLRVPCNRANFWTRILEDSQHCATFACITPECLETKTHNCRGRQKGPWLKGIASLDTEVCYHQLHQDDPAQEDVNLFKPGADYFIGKPGSNLRAKLQVPTDPAERLLVLFKGTIPESIQRRLHRTLRLREKQTMEQPAEAVVILANPYKSLNVGFTT